LKGALGPPARLGRADQLGARRSDALRPAILVTILEWLRPSARGEWNRPAIELEKTSDDD
jgi:hypothetical protein